MSERCLNFDRNSLRYVCRICLEAKVDREMCYEEVNWYQNMSNASSLLSPSELCVCWVCGHLLRKYMRFLHQCQNAHYLLTQLAQDTKTNLTGEKMHNFIQTMPTINSIPPTVIDSHSDVDVKLEDSHVELDSMNVGNGNEDRVYSDDDLPLMSFKDDDNLVTKKVKKKKRLKKAAKDKSISSKTKCNVKNVVDGDTQTDGQTDKPQSAAREGFSSRMRQETEEYRVIKLTQEQVIAEMKARRSGEERYVRAPHKCARCVLGFNFKDVLDAHMRKHEQERGAFECAMCGQYCPSAVSLRGHVKSHTTRYECKVCGCVRRCRQHLLEHHRTAHAAPPPPLPHPAAATASLYRCDHCHFTTSKRTVIQRHVRTSHGAGARAQHACTHAHCHRRFKTIDALRVHISRHDKSSALVCGECGRRFVFASLLKRHQDAVHVRGDYYCVECDVRFGSPYNLQLHFKRAKRHRDTSSDVKSEKL